MTDVSVMRDRYVRGWPRHDQGERVYRVELGRALCRSYTTDAHFVQYVSSVDRRLTREALDQGCEVQLTTIVFDLDCAEVHGTSEPASAKWRVIVNDQYHRLTASHPGGFLYHTRGGARVVYTQAEPTLLRSQEDARRWSQSYAVAVAYLSRRFGIVADPACGDWQRCFRLPCATREGAPRPESWPMLGNVLAIGPLSIDASPEDLATARRSSKAFSTARVADFTPSTASGYGLLYYLLRNRGDLVREHGAHAFVIRCPRESEHSTGRTGDGSTLLYLPAAGEEVGAICCLHAHCSSMQVRDWLAEFRDDEKDRARADAGITRAA